MVQLESILQALMTITRSPSATIAGCWSLIAGLGDGDTGFDIVWDNINSEYMAAGHLISECCVALGHPTNFHSTIQSTGGIANGDDCRNEHLRN